MEEQELEYALSLIEDLERESIGTRPNETEEQQEQQPEEQQPEEQQAEEQQPEEEEEAEQNPSPRTLREMRRAYFEGLESRREARLERERDYAKPTGQTEPPRRRLRSGRSY